MNNTLQKYNKYGSRFDQLATDIFQDVFSDPFFALTRNWAPQNTQETEKEYVIEVELPGLTKQEVKVSATANTITIDAKNSRKTYFHQFSVYDTDTEKTDVKLENGVLTVKVPKKPEAVPKERLLEIK